MFVLDFSAVNSCYSHKSTEKAMIGSCCGCITLIRRENQKSEIGFLTHFFKVMLGDFTEFSV